MQQIVAEYMIVIATITHTIMTKTSSELLPYNTMSVDTSFSS